MKSELIVDVKPDEVSIALLEDSRLVSLQKETRNIEYAVGDIYVAKIRKLMPGLNAAFVNVGYEKDAFLHYLDLGAHFATYKEFMKKLLDDRKQIPSISEMTVLPDIDKHGSVTQQLTQGQEVMVQIVKEPISSKGPRLTTEITFTGRYMVLVPFSDKISVSQKIKTSEEKSRLRQLIASIKPKNFGVIIRTSAEGKRVAELINEMKTLLKCWEDTCAKCQKVTAPALVFEEESRIVGMLRDVFSPTFEAIHVNDADITTQIQNYVNIIAPERGDIVKTYTKPEPIFDTFGVTRQIKSSFGKTVSFKSGAYIIIEHTEALHVIDVNSGNRTKADTDQESNALDVNMRAADEIARQLRLRDMGGIIVVDFIDMAKNEHRQQLYEHMKEVMANDRARHNILPLSKFGLMQITRQRVRPALDITTAESCPSCGGRGSVRPSLLFTDTLFSKLEYVCKELGCSNFIMYVHPYVDAYIKKGWLLSLAAKWKRQLGHNFRIIPDQSLSYLEYKVIDKDGNVLDLKEEQDTESSSRSKKNSKAALRSLEISEDDEPKTVSNSQKTAKAKTDKNKQTADKNPTTAEITSDDKGENESNEKSVPSPTPPASNGRKAQQRRRKKEAQEATASKTNPHEADGAIKNRPEDELLSNVQGASKGTDLALTDISQPKPNKSKTVKSGKSSKNNDNKNSAEGQAVTSPKSSSSANKTNSTKEDKNQTKRK